MHTHVMANIQQQTRASAPDSGPGQATGGGLLAGVTLAGIAAGVRRDWKALQTGEGWEGLVQTPVDKIKELAGTADVAIVRDGTTVEDYGPNWQRLIDLDHDGPFFKYKESPVFNALHDNPHVQRAGELLGNAHATAVLGKLDKAGKGLGMLNTAVSGVAAVGDLSQHHYAQAVGSGLDATSSALMNSDNPAAFLAGFDVALLKKDYELGSQIDWSQGIPNPFNADNFRNDYVPTFRSLPGQLVSTLAGII